MEASAVTTRPTELGVFFLGLELRTMAFAAPSVHTAPDHRRVQQRLGAHNFSTEELLAALTQVGSKEGRQALANLAICPKTQDEAELVASSRHLSAWLLAEPKDAMQLMLDLALHGHIMRLGRWEVLSIAARAARAHDKLAIQLLDQILVKDNIDEYSVSTLIRVFLEEAVLQQADMDSESLLLLFKVLTRFTGTGYVFLGYWNTLLRWMRRSQTAVLIIRELKDMATNAQIEALLSAAIAHARACPEFVISLAGFVQLFARRMEPATALECVDLFLDGKNKISAPVISAVAHVPGYQFSEPQARICMEWLEVCAPKHLDMAAFLVGRILEQRRVRCTVSEACLERCLCFSSQMLSSQMLSSQKLAGVGIRKLFCLLAQDPRHAARIVRSGYVELT